MDEIRKAMDGIVQGKQILRDKDVIRSERLTGEIGEWLVEKIYGGKRAESTTQKGYDLIINEEKYQVKTHAKGDDNKARWSAVNNEKNLFDYLIIIVMTKELYLKEFYKIPHDEIFTKNYNKDKKLTVRWDHYKNFSMDLKKLNSQNVVKYFLKKEV